MVKYVLCNIKGTELGEFDSLVKARKYARSHAYVDKSYEYAYTHAIYKVVDYEMIPIVDIKMEMFIRPKYEFKCFGREHIYQNGKFTGKYKYYVIGKDGQITLTDPDLKFYFTEGVKSGVWESRKRR